MNFSHRPSCRGSGVGRASSGLKVVSTDSKVLSENAGIWELTHSALPLPRLAGRNGYSQLTCGQEMCVMFVHFADDSGDIL